LKTSAFAKRSGLSAAFSFEDNVKDGFGLRLRSVTSQLSASLTFKNNVVLRQAQEPMALG
jgi:hypothetical protein